MPFSMDPLSLLRYRNSRSSLFSTIASVAIVEGFSAAGLIDYRSISELRAQRMAHSAKASSFKNVTLSTVSFGCPFSTSEL